MKYLAYETLLDALEDTGSLGIIEEIVDYDDRTDAFDRDEVILLIAGLLNNKTEHSFYLGEEESEKAHIDKQRILDSIETYINRYSEVKICGR